MATVAIRSGVRRFVACSAKSAIHAAAEVASPAAAAFQIQAGAPTAALSFGAPYAPRVDPLNPAVLLRGAASTSRGTPIVGPQADLPSTVVHLRSVASIDKQVEVERERPRVRTCRSQCQTESIALLASGFGTSTFVRRVAPACHSSSQSYHSKAYAGAGTSLRRSYSSTASPFGSSSATQITTWSAVHKLGVRQFSSGASENPKEDYCKYDKEAVLKCLEKIDSKVGEVGSKVDDIAGKIDQNSEDCAKLKSEVDLLKMKHKGSGDWTSFRIKGKNLNWLSVCSAAWEAIKAIYK